MPASPTPSSSKVRHSNQNTPVPVSPAPSCSKGRPISKSLKLTMSRQSSDLKKTPGSKPRDVRVAQSLQITRHKTAIASTRSSQATPRSSRVKSAAGSFAASNPINIGNKQPQLQCRDFEPLNDN